MQPGKSSGAKQYGKLRRLSELKKTCAIFFYKPYVKQAEFHAAGNRYRERLLIAGNQLGKTYAAGCEVTYHVTGLYPDDWIGRKYTSAPRFWVGGLTSEMCRDGAQRILLGPIGKWGTGCIPKELIVEIKRARGVPDSIESILIRHITGEIAQITFKAYSDGREAWQSETLDGVWFDEEPPIEIYTEGITRTNNTMGLVFLTFTPLLGLSSVVMRFREKDPNNIALTHPDRHTTNMTIDDVGHYTEEEKIKIIASYPAHERQARTRGEPMLGSGRIFPVSDDQLIEDDIPNIPKHWHQIIGMDFGYDHPTAAVKLAWDKSTDVVHVVACYREKETLPIMHAAAIKPMGEWVPVSWPHDANQHDKAGAQYSKIYRDLGLRMLSEHAAHPDGSISVEPGIAEMLERMETGRFKVAASLSRWWEEFRMYHRKNGKIIKERDDIMAATRYAYMMLRFSLPAEQASQRPDRYATRGTTNERTWMSA